MNSEQKTRAISKLATLSANSISPSSFVTELVHNVFQECNPTGAFLARLTREGNLKMLAAYGYSDSSDLDLHLIVDIPKNKPELVELYDAKKNQYNSKFDIKIKTIPVELYVQDSKQTQIGRAHV